jgi:hypothetical protein
MPGPFENIKEGDKDSEGDVVTTVIARSDRLIVYFVNDCTAVRNSG